MEPPKLTLPFNLNDMEVKQAGFVLLDGVVICQELEPKLAEIGYHLALAGSLLYRGESTKDIDILIYPHTSQVNCHRKFLVEKLETFGFIPTNDYDGTELPEVHKTKKDNKRIDFFFLNR